MRSRRSSSLTAVSLSQGGTVEIVAWLLKLVGLITVAGGGLVAIVYAGVKLFATRWLENRFSKSLETFKHENQARD
jgi:hypothetical protein